MMNVKEVLNNFLKIIVLPLTWPLLVLIERLDKKKSKNVESYPEYSFRVGRAQDRLEKEFL